MKPRQSSSPVWLIAVAALVAVGLYILGGTGVLNRAATETADRPAAAIDQGSFSNGGVSGANGRLPDLDPITVDELPPEALETLERISQGGPHPFDRDDTVFQNREGLLPDRDRGYYREYTVVTPGEDDRGARRIVAGAGGDRYYTADHYRSFREIVGAAP
ncbi:MAG: hypothetical protein OER95_07440 [Acidimicrobiia bacterium]|nr:hypothetical protein [Acidimicrobiia bacterium]